MKRMFLGVLFVTLGLFYALPLLAKAEVSISVSLPLIRFSGEPEMIVLPDTDVYVDPDVDADIYFYDGWWWRPWQGRWYRSHRYDAGWEFYNSVPLFYVNVNSGWRSDYREHRWRGHTWNYQRVSHREVQSNWNSWKQNKHWEKQNPGGAQGMKSHSAPAQASHAVPPSRAVQPSHAVQPSRSVQEHAVHSSRSWQQHEVQPSRPVQPMRAAQPSRAPQPSRAVDSARDAQPSQNSQPASQPAQTGQGGREKQPGGGEAQPRSEGGQSGGGGREHGGR